MKKIFIASAVIISTCGYLSADSVQEHYQRGYQAYQAEKWSDAAKEYKLICETNPDSTFAHEAYFYLGVSQYHLADYETANESLTEYLNCQSNPRYFQEAIEYKFYIAEQFRFGERKHLMGYKVLPRWSSAKETALDLYDEAIAAMPSSEIAAKSLYSKGCLFWELQLYKESIEAYQTLIRRFPKDELTPLCYSLINKVYYDQSKKEYQNSDLLTLAEINQRRFAEAFPREERIVEGEQDILKIKEIYARGLYETGMFYERLTKPAASVMYYRKAITEFPETTHAGVCRKRLEKLCPSALENLG